MGANGVVMNKDYYIFSGESVVVINEISSYRGFSAGLLNGGPSSVGLRIEFNRLDHSGSPLPKSSVALAMRASCRGRGLGCGNTLIRIHK